MSAKIKVSRWKRWKGRDGIRNAEFSELQKILTSTLLGREESEGEA